MAVAYTYGLVFWWRQRALHGGEPNYSPEPRESIFTSTTFHARAE